MIAEFNVILSNVTFTFFKEANMAFDGLLMHQLNVELQPLLIGGRIDKVFQPEKDELTINIRGNQGNQNLFISVDASMPFITCISDRKENPQAPPMFCMLMRKHLTGGKIHAFEQIEYERVFVISIESKNELGDPELKKLIIEIMGKHSNIILTKEDFTIIDSIKRITPDMSRVRSILPGLKYTFLESDKISFSKSTPEIINHLKNHASDQKLFKAFYENIQGFSPLASRWLCERLNLDPTMPMSALVDADYERLETNFQQLKHPITNNGNGYVYYDEQDHPKLIYFMEGMDPLLKSEPYPTLVQAIEKFYLRSNRENKMHQRTQSLKKLVAQRIERFTTKLSKQELELIDAENANDSRKIGDLILSNIYLISKGMNRVELTDYYVDPPVIRTVELDTRLEPSENAQVHFKKYNKLKNALLELTHHIEETRSDVTYLENVLTHLEHSEDAKLVDEIKDELIEQGYLKGKPQKKAHKTAKLSYKKYHSSTGFEIWVGKSSLQNDMITTKLASNKDIWLHTKDIPGSHVIIRTSGALPDEQTLFEAAMIAAYYSKARESSNVPVDYTQIKNVSKPSGAKPGMVIYVGNKTLFVTPKLETIELLEDPRKH